MKQEGFAKLKGYHLEYYLQKLQVTLGRDKHSKKNLCDIELGNYKTISRKHAIITYNFQKRCFEITCLSKNGMKINDQFFTHKSVAQPLNHGAEVQLGDSYFIFLLPVNAVQNFYLEPIFEEKNEEEIKKRTAQLSNSGIILNETVHEKPTENYSSMIVQALSAQENKRLTLQDIYQYIMDTYPYFKTTTDGWKSSVRHNLSLNKLFSRVPQEDIQDGKRAVYQLNPNIDIQENKNSTGKALNKRKIEEIETTPTKKTKLE
eukprot:gene5923-9753_t